MRAISEPVRQCTQVFSITINRIRYYWTGEYDRAGQLQRSPHRADARKFPSRDVALTVAETHPQLRNSDQWVIAPYYEKNRK